MTFVTDILAAALIICLSLGKRAQGLQCYVCVEDLSVMRSSGCRDNDFDVSRVQVQTGDTQLNIGRVVMLPSAFNCSICAVYRLHSYQIIVRSCQVDTRYLRKVPAGEANFCFTDYCNDNSISSSSSSSSVASSNHAPIKTVYYQADSNDADGAASINGDTTVLDKEADTHQLARRIDNLYILLDIRHLLAASAESPSSAAAVADASSSAVQITWSTSSSINWLLLATLTSFVATSLSANVS